jgi:sec-independent protein translocase protein TatB
MFGLSVWHISILMVVGLIVFGPERLPSLMRDLGKALRQVRQTANAMQEDLKSELGPEVGDLDLRSLHPRTFVEKHLFGDEEDPLGLDFLRKDAEPMISFDKPNASRSTNGEQATRDNQTRPDGSAPGKTLPRLDRYDLDAT